MAVVAAVAMTVAIVVVVAVAMTVGYVSLGWLWFVALGYGSSYSDSL